MSYLFGDAMYLHSDINTYRGFPRACQLMVEIKAYHSHTNHRPAYKGVLSLTGVPSRDLTEISKSSAFSAMAGIVGRSYMAFMQLMCIIEHPHVVLYIKILSMCLSPSQICLILVRGTIDMCMIRCDNVIMATGLQLGCTWGLAKGATDICHMIGQCPSGQVPDWVVIPTHGHMQFYSSQMQF